MKKIFIIALLFTSTFSYAGSECTVDASNICIMVDGKISIKGGLMNINYKGIDARLKKTPGKKHAYTALVNNVFNLNSVCSFAKEITKVQDEKNLRFVKCD